jgi:polyhydroxyalkanoate synthesis regulator phasin
MRKHIQKRAGSVAHSELETAGEGALALGRTAWLLSLGVAASAGVTGVAVLVAVVQKGRRRGHLPVEKAHRAFAETGSQMVKLATDAGKMDQKRIAELLGQLGLPSRADVSELTRRVETLRQKLS